MKNLFLYLALLFIVPICAQDIYLYCGTVIDTDTGDMHPAKTIIVSGNKIKSIRDGYVTGAGDHQIIDLKDKVVLPGLIDMHVHIESEFSPQTYIKRFTNNDVDVAFESTVYAKRTLMAGFTAVRDLGGSGVNIALRNAINKGLIEGPRIFTCGKALATTGGHADPTNGMKRELMGDPGPKEGVVNSKEDGKKAVRQRYKNGADVIKITATGGVLSVAKSGQNPQFTLEEIQAITSTAKDYSFSVAAHAHGDEGMKLAVLGGVNTIEHGTLMSEETMELMKEKGCYLIPTISAGKQVAEKAKQSGFFPEVVAKKALEIGPKHQATMAKAYKKGVPMGFGTDAGVFPHGMNAIEFGYLLEAGIPVRESLKAATVTNAALLDMSDSLGQLKEGFLADIIAVEEDPTKDVKSLEKVVFVMKDGLIYKQ
ncbi:amidohydrolase family protein [Flavobacteriaceae bacterium TP-CH-4]|uniref:Amidohydrolase family protein n=1 Tax=Pelagihabitans pacificus TaxID=2696054 RepID=A0A967AXK7_9FLAO|nr:amidohydrolase family protein [Pelagihabitans pacificus]NHF58436.1 amidohydrolase family protein [Pelagihabitans pacificus]